MEHLQIDEKDELVLIRRFRELKRLAFDKQRKTSLLITFDPKAHFCDFDESNSYRYFYTGLRSGIVD